MSVLTYLLKNGKSFDSRVP